MTLKKFLKLKKSKRFAEFVDWLGAQDPDTSYDYSNVYGCPIARFAQDLGALVVEGNWTSFYFSRERHEVKLVPKRGREEMQLAFESNEYYGDLWAALSELRL